MNRFSALILLGVSLFWGCGTAKKIEPIDDPMIGTYLVTAYDIPSYGNVNATFSLEKDQGIYKADIKNDLNMLKVNKTEVIGSNIYIEAKAGSHDIYFDLNITGDSVNGWLSDMYRVSGIKQIKKTKKTIYPNP